jgi:transposase
MLLAIKSIGLESAAILWSEGLCRRFDNAAKSLPAGLAPTPWQSRAIDREHGVSQAASPRLLKKTTIVALAVKLLVALRKYVTAGVIVEGAIVMSV